MWKKPVIFCVIILIVIIIIFGIYNTNKEESNNIKIMTSFYPMYIATVNMTNGIEDIYVKNIVSNSTGCIHDYTLTPEEMINISKADTIVINGNKMEPFIDNVLKNYPNIYIIDTSENVDVVLNQDEINPHTFASISNYIIQIKNLKEKLIQRYPQYEEKIVENYDVYVDKLNDLLDYGKEKLNKLNGVEVISLNESFIYFAKDFGINVIESIEEEGMALSATDIVQIIKQVEEKDIKYIIEDQSNGTETANIIVEATGIVSCNFDAAISGENSLDAYINIMKNNIDELSNMIGGV